VCGTLTDDESAALAAATQATLDLVNATWSESVSVKQPQMSARAKSHRWSTLVGTGADGDERLREEQITADERLREEQTALRGDRE
jgi:hypothetical protein